MIPGSLVVHETAWEIHFFAFVGNNFHMRGLFLKIYKDTKKTDVTCKAVPLPGWDSEITSVNFDPVFIPQTYVRVTAQSQIKLSNQKTGLKTVHELLLFDIIETKYHHLSFWIYTKGCVTLVSLKLSRSCILKLNFAFMTFTSITAKTTATMVETDNHLNAFRSRMKLHEPCESP